MRHGKHIKILGRGAATLLGSVDVVMAMLQEVVFDVGMRPLAPPTTFDVPLEIEKLGGEVFEDEGGVTGFIVLSTSHCAVHTWPLRSFFVFDLFSCRDFDADLVVERLRGRFGAYAMKVSDLSESLDFGE
jgi:S-adenosylmethionine decarboxylase